MTKIEKPAALDCLPQLIALSDAVMVARGDLGVEMPPETIPSRQKQIINACRLSGVPVVVATQMLESMISSPAPTRAEASDVATSEASERDGRSEEHTSELQSLMRTSYAVIGLNNKVAMQQCSRNTNETDKH